MTGSVHTMGQMAVGGGVEEMVVYGDMLEG
jgi:hypothetical protein